MSRGGDRGYSAEFVEERDRDYYDTGRRRGLRTREDVDIEVSRERPRRPDFLRDDVRPPAGALIVKEEETISESDYRSPPRRRPHRYSDEYAEQEEILWRRPRDQGRDRSRGPPREREDVDISVRVNERETAAPRPRRRDVEREEIDVEVRRSDGPRERGPRSRGDIRETVVVKEQDSDVSRHRRSEVSSEEIDVSIKKNDTGRLRRPRRQEEREEVDVRVIERERSTGPPGRHIARETEEIVYRRKPRSPSPPRQETEEIIIRRKERSPSPVAAPSPPPPEPEIRRPPIIQEVITHHRHIDHGYVRAPPSSSSSPSPPPRRDEEIEVEIRRRNGRGEIVSEDIRITDNQGRGRREEEEYRSSRQRSRSAVARRDREEIDIDITETSRARYAAPPRDVPNTVVQVNVDGDRRVGLPVRPRPKDLWTEITKDLVIQEAIEAIGYRYEETDDYFYVMENLRYEEVLELVEMSDDIRRHRRERIEEIQWERQDPRLAPPPFSRRPPPTYEDPRTFDERIYEREVVYENGRPIRYSER